MKLTRNIVFELTQEDIVKAIKLYVQGTHGKANFDILLDINPGSPYGDQFDPGCEASVTATATIKEK